MPDAFLSSKKSWIQSMGDPITIIRSGGNVSTYARYVKSRQMIQPMQVNLMRFMIFPADSGIEPGDVIQNQTTSEQCIVAGYEYHTLKAAVSGIYTELFIMNYPSVTVTRAVADQNVTRDKFGKPTQTLVTATIGISVIDATEDITAVAAGGKPKEVLTFYAQNGAILENDEVSWNGHAFRTRSVLPFGLSGQTKLVYCKADREVDM